MDNAQQETAMTKTKQAAPVRSAGQKRAENSMANKQRKKRAHRRTLRRSNTNG